MKRWEIFSCLFAHFQFSVVLHCYCPQVGGPGNSFSRTQETQTPPERSSRNRIAALIAQRRDVIVRKAEKEERENEKHLDERIKRAARLLSGKEEVEMEESSDEDNEPSVNEEDVIQEGDDDDNDVERQEKVDKLLGDLCESRTNSSSSNPRLNALRQKRLKLLLDEDSSSSSESDTVASNSRNTSPTNALEQSEPIPEGPMPGPSCQKVTSDLVSVSQEGLPESDRICDPKQAFSDEMDEEVARNEDGSSKTSQAKVHFKKLGSRGGGRSFRKRSHEEA